MQNAMRLAENELAPGKSQSLSLPPPIVAQWDLTNRLVSNRGNDAAVRDEPGVGRTLGLPVSLSGSSQENATCEDGELAKPTDRGSGRGIDNVELYRAPREWFRSKVNPGRCWKHCKTI